MVVAVNLSGRLARLYLAEIHKQQALRQLLRPPSAQLVSSLVLQRLQFLTLHRLRRSSSELRFLGRVGHQPRRNRNGRFPSPGRRQTIGRRIYREDLQSDLHQINYAGKSVVRRVGQERRVL